MHSLHERLLVYSIVLVMINRYNRCSSTIGLQDVIQKLNEVNSKVTELQSDVDRLKAGCPTRPTSDPKSDGKGKLLRRGPNDKVKDD